MSVEMKMASAEYAAGWRDASASAQRCLNMLLDALQRIEVISAVGYHQSNVSTEKRREQLRLVNEAARKVLTIQAPHN